MKRQILFGAIAFIILSLIGWAILASNLGLPNPFLDLAKAVPHGDKIGHFLLFGLLASVLHLASNSWKIFRVPVWPFLVLVFAFVEEFSQMFIETRTFNPWDLVCDVLGVTFFVWLAERFLTRTKRQKNSTLQ